MARAMNLNLLFSVSSVILAVKNKPCYKNPQVLKYASVGFS